MKSSIETEFGLILVALGQACSVLPESAWGARLITQRRGGETSYPPLVGKKLLLMSKWTKASLEILDITVLPHNY